MSASLCHFLSGALHIFLARLTSMSCNRFTQALSASASPTDGTCFVWQVFHLALPFLGPAVKSALVTPSNTKLWR